MILELLNGGDRDVADVGWLCVTVLSLLVLVTPKSIGADSVKLTLSFLPSSNRDASELLRGAEGLDIGGNFLTTFSADENKLGDPMEP